MAEAKSLDRVTPHNFEAEQAVLGAMMLDGKQIDEAAQTLTPEDFYRDSHGVIFETMCDLRDKGVPVDALSLRDALESKKVDGIGGKSQKAIDAVGGPVYLMELGDACLTSASAKTYADIVRKLSQLRNLIRIGAEIVATGYDQPESVDDAITEAMNNIMGLALSSKRGAMRLDKAMLQLMREVEQGKKPYIAPPFLPYVHAQPGAVVILAAGTSVGKTMLALDWADHWSKTMQVAFFEYEMNETSLAGRLMAKYSCVSMNEMEDGLEADQLAALQNAGNVLASRKLIVEAMKADGTAALFAKIRRAATLGVKVVFIDHLGLVPIKVAKGTNYAKAVGMELTNKLKRLALELGIVVVLLAQLNRTGQSRTGKERHPMLYDLRDSGEIEQDADIVIMAYREARHEDDHGAAITAREEAGVDPAFPHDVLWLGVRKNRNGQLGQRYVGSIPAYNLIFNLDQEDPFDEVRQHLNDARRAAEAAARGEQQALV